MHGMNNTNHVKQRNGKMLFVTMDALFWTILSVRDVAE
jgi:hypothetical protein